MDVNNIPVETLEYNNAFVYACPSSFGNKEDGFKLAYIPAVEAGVLGKISDDYCGLEILRESNPDEPSLKDRERRINECLDLIGEHLCVSTNHDKCKLKPVVIELPKVKRDENNLRSVWQCEMWDACKTKHEAWHVAMTLVDLSIRRLKMKAKKEQEANS